MSHVEPRPSARKWHILVLVSAKFSSEGINILSLHELDVSTRLRAATHSTAGSLASGNIIELARFEAAKVQKSLI